MARSDSTPGAQTGGLPKDRKQAAIEDEPDDDQREHRWPGEPVDHAIGRSRGGLSPKTHAAVDGRGRPLALVVTAGQAGDSPMLAVLLEAVRVPRIGPGRPRTRPEAVLADKAYSSRGTRALLRARGIKAVIPEPRDQQAHRARRGSAGGRPVIYDPGLYKRRNTVERSFNRMKNWRGLATRYDKLALVYRGESSWPPSSPGSSRK